MKKEKQAKISSLFNQIHSLEASHKINIASSTHQELTQMRKLLLEELNMRTKRQYILRHKIYYEQGNKSGRLLAKAVQNKKVSATVLQYITLKTKK